MSNSSPHAEDIKQTPSEPAEPPRADTEEDLKRNLAERREVLAALAAYDQEINI